MYHAEIRVVQNKLSLYIYLINVVHTKCNDSIVLCVYAIMYIQIM